jgi:hypothetical protein
MLGLFGTVKQFHIYCLIFPAIFIVRQKWRKNRRKLTKDEGTCGRRFIRFAQKTIALLGRTVTAGRAAEKRFRRGKTMRAKYSRARRVVEGLRERVASDAAKGMHRAGMRFMGGRLTGDGIGG